MLAMALVVGMEGYALAQEQAQPTKEHQWLKEMMEGEWEASFGDGMKAVSSSKMGLNGLWLFTTFKGDFGGSAFEGRGVDGYDTNKKKFVGTWIDSMETGIMTLEGTYDAATKTLTHMGQGTMQGQPTKFKMVTVFKDKNEHNWKMFVNDGDQPIMEITYKRKN
jgi:hypothetical protein